MLLQLRIYTPNINDCAFAANAHYIVSDDKHFNELKSIDFPKIEVLKLKEFREILDVQ